MPRPLRGRRRPTSSARPPAGAQSSGGNSLAVATPDAQAHLPELLALEPQDDALARFDALAQETEGGAPALIAALGDSRDAAAGPVLSAIATAAPDKELRKAARRALHRLRSAGLDVTVPVAANVESRAPGLASAGQVTRALVSPIDGSGSRLLWLAVERQYGGLTAFNLALNDLVGLQDEMIADTTVRRFNVDLEQWTQRSSFKPAEVPVEYGLALLSEALALNADGGAPLPRDFVIRRSQLGELPPPPTDALIHKHVSRGQALLMPNLLDESAAVLEEPELESWLFGYEEVRQYAREIRQAEESRLILTTEPRETREQRVLATAVDAVFTPPMRRAYRRRLEETAYLFWVSDRERAARRAVAAAFAIGDTGSLRNHPLLVAIVQRSIVMAIDFERAGGTDPPEFSRSMG
jgi:hypothetical protein